MPKDAPVNAGASDQVRRDRGRGYRGCRPSFTVGRRPIPAAGSTICSTSCMTRRRCSWRLTGSRATAARTRRRRRPDGRPVSNSASGPGVPGRTADAAEDRARSGRCRCRERKIPKPGGSGKVRKLGIPTVADRVVQAALKLVLEPIFEADFLPVSYGFRPGRRAHDAIAEIHHFGTAGYRWVLDADIEAAFDSISHDRP